MGGGGLTKRAGGFAKISSSSEINSVPNQYGTYALRIMHRPDLGHKLTMVPLRIHSGISPPPATQCNAARKRRRRNTH